MSHYIVKLVNGETVYGKLISDESSTKMIVLENPLVWEEYETEHGSGTALVKFMAGSDEKQVPINTSAVVSLSTMSDAFSSFYDAAVAIQHMTDGKYADRLNDMTTRMTHMLMDMQAKALADDSDDIVAYSTADITIH